MEQGASKDDAVPSLRHVSKTEQFDNCDMEGSLTSARVLDSGVELGNSQSSFLLCCQVFLAVCLLDHHAQSMVGPVICTKRASDAHGAGARMGVSESPALGHSSIPPESLIGCFVK